MYEMKLRIEYGMYMLIVVTVKSEKYFLVSC